MGVLISQILCEWKAFTPSIKYQVVQSFLKHVHEKDGISESSMGNLRLPRPPESGVSVLFAAVEH